MIELGNVNLVDVNIPCCFNRGLSKQFPSGEHITDSIFPRSSRTWIQSEPLVKQTLRMRFQHPERRKFVGQPGRDEVKRDLKVSSRCPYCGSSVRGI